jgi:hypothetical protein
VTTILVIFSFVCALAHLGAATFPQALKQEFTPWWFARYLCYAALHTLVGLKLWGVV